MGSVLQKLNGNLLRTRRTRMLSLRLPSLLDPYFLGMLEPTGQLVAEV